MRAFSNKMLPRHGGRAPWLQDERSIEKRGLVSNNRAALARFNVLVHPKKIIGIVFIFNLN